MLEDSLLIVCSQALLLLALGSMWISPGFEMPLPPDVGELFPAAALLPNLGSHMHLQ